jgi:hypothetical protein
MLIGAIVHSMTFLSNISKSNQSLPSKNVQNLNTHTDPRNLALKIQVTS